MASLYAGTSGFAYPAWKPDFYPAKLAQKDFLKHYATRLNAVEINYTFRQLPSASTLENWMKATPEGFVFALKAHQRITHILRLKESEFTQVFFKAIDPLRVTAPPGPGAVPVAAELQGRCCHAGGVPRKTARGHSLRLRVPQRLVAHGGGLRNCSKSIAWRCVWPNPKNSKSRKCSPRPSSTCVCASPITRPEDRAEIAHARPPHAGSRPRCLRLLQARRNARRSAVCRGASAALG